VRKLDRARFSTLNIASQSEPSPSGKDFLVGEEFGKKESKATGGERTVTVHRGKKWSKVFTARGWEFSVNIMTAAFRVEF
jgi:hypothetical protein